MDGELTETGKRGRKAIVKENLEFEVRLQNSDGMNIYQTVKAVNYAEAGKMADGLGRILKLNVVAVSHY